MRRVQAYPRGLLKINDLSIYGKERGNFKEKEDSLYQQNECDKEKIKEICLENPISYEQLIISIKNLPPHFNNTRENIMEKLEKYLERENSLNAYDNERFYKNGLRDGAKMMLEILKIDKFDN